MGQCYKTDYSRNEWSYDREICFCVMKRWNVRNYVEITAMLWLQSRFFSVVTEKLSRSKQYHDNYGHMTVISSLKQAQSACYKLL